MADSARSSRSFLRFLSANANQESLGLYSAPVSRPAFCDFMILTTSILCVVRKLLNIVLSFFVVVLPKAESSTCSAVCLFPLIPWPGLFLSHKQVYRWYRSRLSSRDIINNNNRQTKYNTGLWRPTLVKVSTWLLKHSQWYYHHRHNSVWRLSNSTPSPPTVSE